MLITVNEISYRIRFSHHFMSSSAKKYWRKKRKMEGAEWTTCRIEQVNLATQEVVQSYEDQAFCSSDDNFSRAVGRRLSLTRAMHLMFFTREQRKKAWAAIWEARRKVTDKPWSL